MNELKEIIANAIEDWKDKKIGNIEVDSDTDFEIHQLVENTIKYLEIDLNEMEEEIDTLIEQMNEPSDYEYDIAEDMRARAMDLIGG